MEETSTPDFEIGVAYQNSLIDDIEKSSVQLSKVATLDQLTIFFIFNGCEQTLTLYQKEEKIKDQEGQYISRHGYKKTFQKYSAASFLVLYKPEYL